MLHSSPEWFQSELTRIGGVNQYDEPIYKVVWSEEPRTLVGGRFPDGFIGYRRLPLIPGEPWWALMIFEPSITAGSRESWEREYDHDDCNYYAAGPFPRYGRYRLLRKLMHIEYRRVPCTVSAWNDEKMIDQSGTKSEPVYYKMPLCSLILDMMIPMLMAWKRLSVEMKLAATLQQIREQDEDILRQMRDARQSIKVKRSWTLVQKRAEQLELNMEEAMRRAAKWGLGMGIQQL